jgi:AcrR family transcriptional regulator
MEVDARRRQLIEAAGDAFGHRPYEQVSVEEIADAAGVSRGLLYHYFPGKRALYLEVIRHGVSALLIAMSQPQRMSADDELRLALDAYVRHARSRSYPFGTVLHADREVDAIVETFRQSLLARILVGLPTTARRNPATSLAIRGWMGYVETLTVSWLEHPDIPQDALIELLARPLRLIIAEARALAGLRAI